jgi:hypothetical protein
MKLKALLVVGLLLVGCTGLINFRLEPRSDYTLNYKTVTLGMTNAEVKDAFGPPTRIIVSNAPKVQNTAELILSAPKETIQRIVWYYGPMKRENMFVVFVEGTVTEINEIIYTN